jgi:SnoaL-like domain
MAQTVEEKFTELSDREAIRELPVRYCDCVWRGDVAGIVDLFAEDGSFTVKGPKRETTTKGREALLAMYGEGLRTLTPRPYIHNHVVNLGYYGRATGRCYVELRNASRGMQWAGTGYYEDEYVKAGEKWKFASRLFHAVHLGPEFSQDQPAAKPARPAAKAKSRKLKSAVAARKKTAPAKRRSGR